MWSLDLIKRVFIYIIEIRPSRINTWSYLCAYTIHIILKRGDIYDLIIPIQQNIE